MARERDTKAVMVTAAIAGAVDTAVFLGRRRHLFTKAPGRAAGSVLGLMLWTGLATSAAAERHVGRRTLALASIVAAANAGLLVAHLRAGVIRPRALVGTTLAAVALATAVSGVRRVG
jgi:hypothetical protein